MNTLKLDGYDLYVLFSGDERFEMPETSGFTVKMEYPYKSIYLSISDHTLKLLGRGKANENIKSGLLHEAIHVLLWDYAYLAEYRHTTKEQLLNAEERLVDHLVCVIEDVHNSN